MFGNRFFPKRFFPDRYFAPGVTSDVEPEPEPEPGTGGGGGYGGSLWGKKLRPLIVRQQGTPRVAVELRARLTGSSELAGELSATVSPASALGGGSSIAATATAIGWMSARLGGSSELTAITGSRQFAHPQQDEWLIIDPDDWLGAILNEEELALGGVP